MCILGTAPWSLSRSTSKLFNCFSNRALIFGWKEHHTSGKRIFCQGRIMSPCHAIGHHRASQVTQGKYCLRAPEKKVHQIILPSGYPECPLVPWGCPGHFLESIQGTLKTSQYTWKLLNATNSSSKTQKSTNISSLNCGIISKKPLYFYSSYYIQSKAK
jgi:hypothetical protein